VGLNADVSIKDLKGPNRPINVEGDRAQILAALRCVDAVTLFPEVRATNLLKVAQPDVYVKGGDYTLETLNPEERAVVQAAGAKIVFIPFLEGRSTTSIIERSKG
jgi:rfaE bifunctional protein nucleotidyltransferase chain/domain